MNARLSRFFKKSTRLDGMKLAFDLRMHDDILCHKMGRLSIRLSIRLTLHRSTIERISTRKPLSWPLSSTRLHAVTRARKQLSPTKIRIPPTPFVSSCDPSSNPQRLAPMPTPPGPEGPIKLSAKAGTPARCSSLHRIRAYSTTLTTKLGYSHTPTSIPHNPRSTSVANRLPPRPPTYH